MNASTYIASTSFQPFTRLKRVSFILCAAVKIIGSPSKFEADEDYHLLNNLF